MQIDWETTISYISNIFVAFAAVATVVIAWRGLNTWQEEIRGKAKFDSAHRLFVAVLQLRNEIAYLRSPIQSLLKDDVAYMKEIGVEPEHYLSNTPSLRQRATQAWYQSRWRGVENAMKEVDAAELDAEVVLGTEAIQDIIKLRKLVKELLTTILRYVDSIGDPDPIIRNQTTQRVDTVIFSIGDDEFTLQINEAVESLRAKLKNYLGQ